MEQAEADLETTTHDEAIETSQGIGSILSDALTESQSTPKAGTGTEQVEKKDEAEEPPFLELLLSESNKLPLKTEQDFQAFLERNKVLKDGWMLKADHTRKTQAISEKEKQFEARNQEEQKLWGQAPPDNSSKQALASIWQVYKATKDPIISDAIQKFVTDVQLIAQGDEAVGPLKQGAAAGQTPQDDATRREILKLQQELAGFKNQMSSRDRQALERQQAEQSQKDEAAVDAWISEKEKDAKTKISGDELMVMSDLMSIPGEKGQPKFSLDQAYTLARAHLGKSTADVAKTVLQSAKNLSNKTPKPPASRASSGNEPEPTSIGDIYKQGVKSLA